MQRADDKPQNKMDSKHQKAYLMKKVTPSDGVLHEHKPIIHDRRWTDGSTPWETLPPRLSTLGKVIKSSQIPWSFFCLLPHLPLISYYLAKVPLVNPRKRKVGDELNI